MDDSQVDSSLALPCPFCGEKDEFYFAETSRCDKAIVRNDRWQRYVKISHVLCCGNCGVQGPPTYRTSNIIPAPALELLPEHIEHSQQEAIFAWNQRQAISDKAFELVNKLMASALAAVADT